MNLRPAQIYGILAALLMVSLPHADHLPPWVSTECAMLLGWRGYLAWSGHTLPRRWLLLTLTFASVGGILISFHTLFGRDAGVTLLILLASLKLLELRNLRDATLTIYLASFIIITNFFYSQSIPTALYMMLTLLAILTTWLHLYADKLQLKPRLRIASLLLLQAIPLTLLLFVLFPRVQGPLWGMPQDAHAQSGLTDSMAPGSMSKLSLSEAVAFRVNFEGTQPLREMMYWRGPVLWDFDGTTWSAGTPMRTRLPDLRDTAVPLDYTVTLEPHNKHWLFALEMPTRVSVASQMADDFQLLSRQPVVTRMRYTAHSELRFRANPEENRLLLQRALKLPAGSNPRARQLAAGWRSTYASDDRLIQQAMLHFNRENFVYTLEPPLLGENSVDDFLFKSKQGFCEHYASSFVFLMRAAGIPARVISGYQGGEYNELGGYTIVRQSDAHAWAEVWQKDKGWQRIDPTAAISPARVNSGLSAAIPDSAALPFTARIKAPWLLKLRFNLDLLNHQWNQWILGYNSERQFAFLTRLGMEDITWQKLALNLLGGVGIIVALLAAVMLKRVYARKTDPAHALYLKFCRKLARAGALRAGHEGAQDFAARAAAQHPQLAPQIASITRHYLQLRYQGADSAQELLALRREVAAFRL